VGGASRRDLARSGSRVVSADLSRLPGGAYAVSRENLGRNASLVAASALLVDYVLTVAVSVAAGVDAITSAFLSLRPHAVALSLLSLRCSL
jgi:amino acid transporter